MYKNTCLLTITLLFLGLGAAIGQPKINTAGNSVTLQLQKIKGFGPSGNTSMGIGDLKNVDSVEKAGYPVIKNKPQNLSNVLEYVFILNIFQFYYQGYVAGLYSKEFLVKKVAGNKLKLADTAELSRKPVQCYFYALTGTNAQGEQMFMMDANNNHDLGDDVLRPVVKDLHRPDERVDAAVTVKTTCLVNKNIVEDKLLVYLGISTYNNQVNVSFAFPEFGFGRFLFEGQPYIVCAEVRPISPFVFIMPDRPYFTGINTEARVRLGQLVTLGGSTFTLSKLANNYSEVTLTGNNMSGFKVSPAAKGMAATVASTKQNNLMSAQAGFNLPPIKGININGADTALINTDALKGKYVYIDFWSTTCAPCIEEFKYIKEAYAKFGRNKFEVIGVVDERSKDGALAILKENKVLWPNIKTNTKGTQIKGYENIMSYPTTYLVNPEGKIIAVDLRGEGLVPKLSMLIGR